MVLRLSEKTLVRLTGLEPTRRIDTSTSSWPVYQFQHSRKSVPRKRLLAYYSQNFPACQPPFSHFSEKISPNRPDEEDWESLRRFARLAAKKALNLEEIPQPVQVPGENTLTHYYTPLGADGKPVSFLNSRGNKF